MSIPPFGCTWLKRREAVWGIGIPPTDETCQQLTQNNMKITELIQEHLPKNITLHPLDARHVSDMFKPELEDAGKITRWQLWTLAKAIRYLHITDDYEMSIAVSEPLTGNGMSSYIGVPLMRSLEQRRTGCFRDALPWLLASVAGQGW